MKKEFFIRYDYLWFALGSMLFYAFLLLQGNHLIDLDMYFHIKIASLLKEQGPVFKLPWMAYAIHAEHFVDYQFLYHWLLVPFTFFAVICSLLPRRRSYFTAVSVWASLVGYSINCRYPGAGSGYFFSAGFSDFYRPLFIWAGCDSLHRRFLFIV